MVSDLTRAQRLVALLPGIRSTLMMVRDRHVLTHAIGPGRRILMRVAVASGLAEEGYVFITRGFGITAAGRRALEGQGND